MKYYREFLLQFFCLLLTYLVCSFQLSYAQELLVEAESFQKHGGWKLDTQFIDTMGSPYLLAHGLGHPVQDASTTVEFPETGSYQVFVRTYDWVARWNAKGSPGRFQILVEGKPLVETFGNQHSDWNWQPGGTIDISQRKIKLALHDLTGFDGRCDAIYFRKSNSDSDALPPNESTTLSKWRKNLLGLPETPVRKTGYDLIVIGGGYSGMGASLSAARMGCKVALIQNRPVLGGNGSSEVRVWAQGLIRRGKYPRIGEIIEEFSDHAKKSPGTYEEFGDHLKHKIVAAEPNIDLFLNHHAYKVETKENKIVAVHTLDTRTSLEERFEGTHFVDATGHGTIGHLAKADWEMTPKGRMGMSNMWAWAEAKENVSFPETPWALDLEMKDFPYPRDHHGQWFWESGFDQDPLKDAEAIRDWNLRAVFGAFNAMKNKDGAEKHKTAYLTWVAYIGGTRESRRLLGDVILTQEDIVSKKMFPDGCVPSTWSIDLHYPKKQYAAKFLENPFISIAKHDRRIDRNFGYPVPYRCFYSRKIGNLFMAGRCISVTHEALGTVRVMKTCGMMGEVVGKAAYLCTLHECSPREVYQKHWSEMEELLKLPGKARRLNLRGEIIIPDDALPLASQFGPPSGKDPKSFKGIVIDDRDAKKKGSWTEGTGLKPYISHGYVYSSGIGVSLQFEHTIAEAGRYEIRLAWQAHENRCADVSLLIKHGAQEKQLSIDMRKKPPLPTGFLSLGTLELKKGEQLTVTLSSGKTGGHVTADALQILRAN